MLGRRWSPEVMEAELFVVKHSLHSWCWLRLGRRMDIGFMFFEVGLLRKQKESHLFVGGPHFDTYPNVEFRTGNIESELWQFGNCVVVLSPMQR